MLISEPSLFDVVDFARNPSLLEILLRKKSFFFRKLLGFLARSLEGIALQQST
jgi:hypothetical protein